MSAFAEPTKSDANPRETVISTKLWEWVFLPTAARDELTAPASKLSVALEFWICGLFDEFEFTRSHGIWCDGVIELSIRQLHRRAFLLTGVGWFSDWIAPFEVEMHFPRRRATVPMRSVIRCGELDARGEIRKNTKLKYADRLVANRPKRDRDWAVAVEVR